MKLSPFLHAAVLTVHAKKPAETACNLLQTALPGSVFLPGSSNYEQDISHSALSSTQNATCSVEPSSVEDIRKILGIVSRKDIRSPFAVKGGGHTFNAGFSSTTGVEVVMQNFKAVTYDPSSKTVKVGSGTTWDQVYAQLEQFGVTVPGGRIVGVGVGGLALGGGFSWLTDGYGLAIDNIIKYELVLPNGTFTTVTSTSQPDLFFALKGGFNNFGIVTSFTLKTYPIGQVWGGPIVYGPESNALVASVVSDFSLQNTDIKAQITATYLNVNGTGQWSVALFYDAPTPPPTLFKPFLDIPTLVSDVSSRAFLDFVKAASGAIGDVNTVRQASHTVPILKYTPKIIATVQTHVDAAYAQAVKDNRTIFASAFNVEPFVNPFAHSVPSAYPHDPRRPLTPSEPAFAYFSAADADYFGDALMKLSHEIQAVAVQEGQSLWNDICYSNYAFATTPLPLLYGDNLPRLEKIKKLVDPANVMGLTGGFKL